MELCSQDQLLENQAMLKAIKKLGDTLTADVTAGVMAENKVKAEKKQIVTVSGKKQIR